jgi:hypothetical protein
MRRLFRAPSSSSQYRVSSGLGSKLLRTPVSMSFSVPSVTPCFQNEQRTSTNGAERLRPDLVGIISLFQHSDSPQDIARDHAGGAESASIAAQAPGAQTSGLRCCSSLKVTACRQNAHNHNVLSSRDRESLGNSDFLARRLLGVQWSLFQRRHGRIVHRFSRLSGLPRQFVRHGRNRLLVHLG